MERDSRGRFGAGNSYGHKASGRPPGLAAKARAATADGQELITFFVEVFRGGRGAQLQDQVRAAEWLADRGWGRALQSVELSGADGGPLEIAYVNDWRNADSNQTG